MNPFPSPAFPSQASTSQPVPSAKGKEPLISHPFTAPDAMASSTYHPDKLPKNHPNPVYSFLRAQALRPATPPSVPPSDVDTAEEDLDIDLSSLFLHEQHPGAQYHQPAPHVDEYDEHPDDQAMPDPDPRFVPPDTSDIKKLFTLDDVPFAEWHNRLMDIYAWIAADIERPGGNLRQTLCKVSARFTGRLRDWWMALGNLRRLQLLNVASINEFVGCIYQEFLGTYEDHISTARNEFLRMKVCSYRRADLDKHYINMSRRFYMINGIDDVNLKKTYLNSLPDPLGDEAEKLIAARNQHLSDLSLGQIHHISLLAIEKLCNNHKFLQNVEKLGKELGTACNKPYLQIKCQDKHRCDCRSKKKSRSYKVKDLPRKLRHKRAKGFRRWKFLKKKGTRRLTTDRCYLCGKKGHFAKNCHSRGKAKYAKMIEQAMAMIPDDDGVDLESVFSLCDEFDPGAILAIDYDSVDSMDVDSDSSSSSSSDYEQSETSGINGIFEALQVPSSLGDLHLQQSPLVKVSLSLSAESPPLLVIALLDTGASCSIINPSLLPSHYWKPYSQYFKAANGDVFHIDKVSSPVSISIFPTLTVTHCLLGSPLSGKDLIIGFDILQNIKRLKWSPTGLRHNSHFIPWSTIPALHYAEPLSQIRQQLVHHCCANSHAEFQSKHSSPLWTRSEFFIRLPFKDNIHVTPMKASHQGMNPEHMTLANSELEGLLAQSLIEPTNSPWACEAFYVNKRSEQVRGKMRLVINYQPLNKFLQDDKFPLPYKSSLFQYIADARIFSKFDLKAGFWQLGVHPEERFKTAFTVPNAHYQWTVMPFGLKTAPSLFQKAMIQLFQPLLAHCLVYIDDILLFSPDHDAHARLLQQFHDICYEHGIMLSEAKMHLAKTDIDFLGMHIKDGRYAPQPHIAHHLLQFPDQLTSAKQIQQFLGIVNYVSDFIPHVSRYRSLLSRLLRKDAPSWSKDHTSAVQALKSIVPQLPPLQIPHKQGTRILQTDASDTQWGAVLLQDVNGTRQICGYKSGYFKQSEQHYHSTYKEILAVKNGISKFQFHLVGHHFIIEMDMSAFPNMLHFKNKTLPQPQLLRWSNWFSQWNFTVNRIKGRNNVLADFLSRMHPPEEPPVLPVHQLSLPCLFPLERIHSLPVEIRNMISDLHFRHRTRENIRAFLDIHLFKNSPVFERIPHPAYPYLTPLTFRNLRFIPPEALCFLWYLTEQWTITVIFDAAQLQLYFIFATLWMNDLTTETRGLLKFFEWFQPFHVWRTLLDDHHSHYVEVEFRNPRDLIHLPDGDSYYVPYAHDRAVIRQWRPYNLSRSWQSHREDFTLFKRHMCDLNRVPWREIPANIWEYPFTAYYDTGLQHFASYFTAHFDSIDATTSSSSPEDSDDE